MLDCFEGIESDIMETSISEIPDVMSEDDIWECM